MSIELHSLFQDHAVIQRQRPISIWGWTEPLQGLEFRFADQHAFTVSNDRGGFFVKLPPVEAGGPFQLEVTNTDTGEKVTCKDVYVGEVWLGSGQSNMEWTMESCRPTVDADIDSADFPEIRYFTVGTRAAMGKHDNVDGRWKLVSPETVTECSAVAFSFGRKLHQELDVPVGLLVSAWGGTPIEAWSSYQALQQNEAYAASTENYQLYQYSPERWKIMQEASGGTVTQYPLDPGQNADGYSQKE